MFIICKDINMKLKIFTILLLLMFAHNAKSEDLYLRDFNEVINQEQSISNYVYIFERCSGLFASIGNRFLTSGRSDSKDLGNKMMLMGTEFTMGAVNIAKTQKLNVTIESSMRKAVSIGKIYSSIMDDNHNRTGNSLGGQIAKDQSTCIALYKVIKAKK